MSRTEILLLIAALLLLTLVSLYFLDKKLKNNRQQEVIKKLKTIGTVEKDGGSYFLVMGHRQIQIIFLALKPNEFLTVNSNTMMQIDRGNQKPLLIKYNYEAPPYKWLFVVPGLNRVKRAINENEVVFVNYQTEFNNFRVIKEDEVDLLIEEHI